MEVTTIRPLLAPLVSILCAGLVFVTGKSAFLRRFWSLSAATLKLGIVLSMLPGSLAGVVYVTRLIPFTPGISIEFRVDALGMFFGLVSSTLWVLTTIYAIGYMEPEHAKVRFFGFFALTLSTTIGIAFAGNLFTLFIFYEMLTICTYPLVIHEETPEAMKAGRKYLIYTFPAGALILIGIAFTFYLTETTTLSQPGILSLEHGLVNLYSILALFVVGFGVKASIIPLHSWLPTAMVAPTPVSALLHAVAVVKAGVFGLLRVMFNIFGAHLLKELGAGLLLAYIASFTIIGGSVIALLQDNLKRRLAYSTISQLSYIILGTALLTPLSVIGGVLHLANQAFQKITMFFVAGAIERKTGKTKISELEGIGHQMPWTMGAFTVSSLGFIGVPLFAAFITKWYICRGALEAHQPVFVAVMLISSLLNATYWFPIIHSAYFKQPETKYKVNEASWTLLLPTLICALYIIVLGTFSTVPGLPLSLARTAVRIALKL